MTIGYYVADFFAGLFLCNCIPHLAAGLRGEPFPSPFAKPPGKGLSSPVVNVLWGTANLIFGYALLDSHPISAGLNLPCGLFFAGFLAIGLHLAGHFGAVRAGKSK